MKLLRPYRASNGRKLAVRSFTSTSVVGASQTLQWIVIPPTPVSHDQVVGWKILGKATADASVSWSLVTSVAGLHVLSWRVDGLVLALNRIARRYRVGGNKVAAPLLRSPRPYADHAIRWNSAGRVVRDQAIGWAVLPQASGGVDQVGDAFFTAMGAIGSVGGAALTDNRITQVNRDHILTWSVQGPSGAIDSIGDAFQTQIGAIAAAGSVSLSSPLLTVAQAQALSWGVLNAAGQQQTLTWTVNTKAGADQALLWKMGDVSTVSADQLMQWQMTAFADRRQDLTWSLLQSASQPQTIDWSVLSQFTVRSDQAVRWALAGRVWADQEVAWDSGGRVTSNHAMLWRLGDLAPLMVDAVVIDSRARAELAVTTLSARDATPFALVAIYRG